jgi:hypothetical protein
LSTAVGEFNAGFFFSIFRVTLAGKHRVDIRVFRHQKRIIEFSVQQTAAWKWDAKKASDPEQLRYTKPKPDQR